MSGVDSEHELVSSTISYLTGRLKLPQRCRSRACDKFITLSRPSGHNLRGDDVKFPLEAFTCVTGPSGSGKSSLILETLYPAVRAQVHDIDDYALPYRCIGGVSNIFDVQAVDQSPIGKNIRSTVATYTGIFDYIRKLYASTAMAKTKRIPIKSFSFNVAGGRCEFCKGLGFLDIKESKSRLQQLFSGKLLTRSRNCYSSNTPDMYTIQCPKCMGSRYEKEILTVTLNGYSIAEVLEMTVSEAGEQFAAEEPIARRISALHELGLGYLVLGHSSAHLSGGEAQRVKLAVILAKRKKKNTLYIFDEPTRDLHYSDIHSLMYAVDTLVDNGNTVIAIEHNLDVIAYADWMVDLGPKGGLDGGSVIYSGRVDTLL